jgi:flagellar biosynthesis protein
MVDKEEKKTRAIALEYDKANDPAPKLVAKGEGTMAEQILKIAAEHNIPIREDANLVEILSVLEVDSYIPFESYVAVAEILSYIYQENAKKRSRS